ncbi:helix-turn-helix domain-containing protein [Paenibacillus sp. GCM10012303]|uniref:helix-turn-helix domain-containing protein n=1 Tax=Paenibacillus sp. GCM10012303 TaxID=3317340 RepID=UPI00361A2569
MIRSHRFYNYLFSYILLVILLLVAVSGVVYQNFFETLRQEVEHSTVSSLSQFRDAVDLRIREMNRMASQISSNPQLTPFVASDGGYGTLQAITQLRQYASTNLFITDVVLYYKVPGISRLYASSGTYDLGMFFDTFYTYSDWSKDEFIRTADKLSAPLLRPTEEVMINRLHNAKFATYLVPIPLNAEVPYGTALFLIREDAWVQAAQGVLSESDGLLFVLNREGEVLFSQENGGRSPVGRELLTQIRSTPDREAITGMTAQGRKFSVLTLKSDNRDWTYVAALPTDQWMSKVNETRGIFNLTVTIVFLTGVLIAFGFSMRHYKPLKRLAGIVSSQHKTEPLGGRRDEIDYISRAIGSMAKEKESLLHRLRSHGSALREQVLLTLIKGKLRSVAEVDDMLQFSNLRLDKPYYAVLLFMIDDYNSFRCQNSEKMQEVLAYSLMKVVEELACEVGTGFGAESIDGRSIVFLLNLNEGFDDPEALRQLADQAKAFFRQYYRLTVTVGIGGIYSDLASVPKSYVEASHAARYRFVKGGDQVISFREIEPRQSGEYAYPVERIDQLVKAIRQGDGCSLEQAVRDAFSHIVETNVSLEAAECICFDIVNNIMKTLIELEIEIDDDLGETLEQLFVPRFETIEELEQLVVRICLQVCGCIMGQKESKNVVLLDSMKAYIELHYADQTLNLETIAGRFGLSPSYATRFFKDQTGCPLMRYIDSIRMERAKELIKSTEMTLKDIMGEVGYVDSTNFIRKFKKAEGVTPIQYRNLVKGSFVL